MCILAKKAWHPLWIEWLCEKYVSAKSTVLDDIYTTMLLGSLSGKMMRGSMVYMQEHLSSQFVPQSCKNAFPSLPATQKGFCAIVAIWALQEVNCIPPDLVRNQKAN